MSTEQPLPTAFMALGGKAISVALSHTDTVQEIRRKIASTCGVSPFAVELLQGDVVLNDGSEVNSEPIGVIIKQPMDGTYSGSLDVMIVDGEGCLHPTSIPLSFQIASNSLQLTGPNGETLNGVIEQQHVEFKVGANLPVLMPNTETVRVCEIKEVKDDAVRLIYAQAWNPKEKHDVWLPKSSPRIMDLLGTYKTAFPRAWGPWPLQCPYFKDFELAAQSVTFSFDEKEQVIHGAFRDMNLNDDGPPPVGCYPCTAFDGAWGFNNRGASDSWMLSLSRSFENPTSFVGGFGFREMRFNVQKDGGR
eukprot:gb/GFBE01062164.1/.p1 GENE.gb/GFBE01062164.1/~~gb/GFBE01062164.1/.p1  ORF type:complete len:305 (+),score=40.97 gb/GFBE01062164.1/:1-915(+)